MTGWKVYMRNSTGSFFLEAKDPNDHESIEAATRVMEEAAKDPANGIAHLYTPQQIQQMGGDPEAFLAVDPVKGFGFGNNLIGPKVTASTNKGAHGFNPQVPEMRASFVLSGAGIERCSALDGVTIEDVGPTAAALLGAKIPNAQGRDARELERH